MDRSNPEAMAVSYLSARGNLNHNEGEDSKIGKPVRGDPTGTRADRPSQGKAIGRVSNLGRWNKAPDYGVHSKAVGSNSFFSEPYCSASNMDVGPMVA